MANTRILKAGKIAPHFTLESSDRRRVSLKTYFGKPIILVFYPADWSTVCKGQLSLYNELLPEFKKFGAEVLGISVDSANSHSEFARQRNLHFPLLADFEPKGEVAKKYGVYRIKDGITERALFVISADGKIAWSYCSPIGINPGAEGIILALQKLSAAKQKKISR
jgi:peroxiredoxin